MNIIKKMSKALLVLSLVAVQANAMGTQDRLRIGYTFTVDAFANPDEAASTLSPNGPFFKKVIQAADSRIKTAGINVSTMYSIVNSVGGLLERANDPQSHSSSYLAIQGLIEDKSFWQAESFVKTDRNKTRQAVRTHLHAFFNALGNELSKKGFNPENGISVASLQEAIQNGEAYAAGALEVQKFTPESIGVERVSPTTVSDQRIAQQIVTEEVNKTVEELKGTGTITHQQAEIIEAAAEGMNAQDKEKLLEKTENVSSATSYYAKATAVAALVGFAAWWLWQNGYFGF